MAGEERNGRQNRGRAPAVGGRLLTWGPLTGLVLFGGAAVAGYAVFGRNPSLVAALSPRAAAFYGVSFGFFAQAHVLLAAAVLALELWRRAGLRWLGAFVAVYGISLGSELLGTSAGVPFGAYAYTDLLGPKWLGLVPALIPLSWFFMAVPSYGLASWLAGGGSGGWWKAGVRGPGAPSVGGGGVVGRVLLGSLLLLAWDLSLDPAMSEVTRYWVWAEPGPYYGMPLMNLVGWYATGLALMAALEAIGSLAWVGALGTGWLAAFYGANLLLPLGMALSAGMVWAGTATVSVLGGAGLWGFLRRRAAASGRALPAGAEAA